MTWTGVPLKRVVAAAGGLDGSARYAIATGGEAVNPLLDQLFSMRVERSVPLDKALDDCLLACDMNGAPIPLVHGGPLRLIVPGYFGVNQIKYLKRLAFTREQSGADVMRREYRLRPIGKDGDATQPTTWAMGAKSTIWPVANSRVRRGRLLHGAHGELDAGTDDQLGKAFVFPDPPARIAALVRRPTAGMEPDVLRDRIRRWTSAGGRGSTGGEWKRTRTSRHRPGRAQPRFSRHRSSPCA